VIDWGKFETFAKTDLHAAVAGPPAQKPAPEHQSLILIDAAFGRP